MTTKKLNDRVWEIDAGRGLIILGVLVLHTYYTVEAFCIDGYYNIDSYEFVRITDPLRFWFDWGENGQIYPSFLTPTVIDRWSKLGVNGFFVISGISCLFSRDNLRRGLIMLAGAFSISAFTKLIDVISGTDSQFIRFGVLHCYGYCHIIYYFLFKNRSNRTLLLVAAVTLVMGYYLRYHPVYTNSSLLLPFGFRERNVIARDYWPIFPMLGWLLLGVVFGRKFYLEKKSLLPSSSLQWWTRPLQFLGRHSGKIYIGHIFVYTAVFCGIGWIFGLL